MIPQSPSGLELQWWGTTGVLPQAVSLRQGTDSSPSCRRTERCSAWVTGESHSSGQELILQSVSSETFSEC